jgi:hypothetical protein
VEGLEKIGSLHGVGGIFRGSLGDSRLSTKSYSKSDTGMIVKAKQPGEGPKKTRRHVMTAARLRAARKNAKRSTGPRQKHGRFRYNNLRHGMCAMTDIVLPGEDAAGAEQKRQNYINELGATGEAEVDQATLAAAHLIRGIRCLKADAAAEGGGVDDIPRQRGLERELETLRLIDLLDTEPAAALLQLREISNGLTWLLGQIKLLDDSLLNRTSLHPSQRLMALKICGRRPQDMFVDTLILTFDLDVISGCHADAARLTDGELACILQADRPPDVPPGEFQRRLADVRHWLTSPAEAQKAQRDVLAEYRQKLLTQLQVVSLREELGDLRAANQARVSASKECMLRLRYLRESDRGCQGALRELRRLQEWRLKHGAELDIQTPACAPGPAIGNAADTAPETGAETLPAEAPNGPDQTVSRTEAAAPEVAGGSSSCNEFFEDDGTARRSGDSPIESEIARGAAEQHQTPLKRPPPG